MAFGRSVAAVIVAAALAACGTDAPRAPSPAARAEQPMRHDPRLRDDCGGFEPSSAQLDVASALGDPARRARTVATLAQVPAAERVDILRAGLRLRDEAAARSCAARLTWQQIDRWECARCVDLLIEDVLKPGTQADFEEFRSYLGSVDLPRFLRSLPPLPWTVAPDEALGEMHRISMGRHMPDYVELTRHADPQVADAAWSDISLLGRWNDDHRDEVARREVEVRGRTVPDVPDGAGPGLPPVLAAWLRAEYLDPGPEIVNDGTFLVWNEKIRWLWECTPGPRDDELLMALAQRGPTNWTTVSGVAYVLLGKLSDPATDVFLREKATDTDQHYPEQLAVWALARRGDAAMLEKLAADARDVTGFDDYALALLMEIAPDRARHLIAELLFGSDDETANDALDFLQGFAAPGAFFEPCGYDWRRTSFDGFERAAIDATIPAMRLARIGVVVPGCRTRALAAAAARALAPGDLVENEDVAAFLETAAAEEFANALRRIEAADGDDAALAAEWLAALRDETAGSERAAVLDGRSVDALAESLAAKPDEEHGNVGAVDDPRVRAYLARLRERRDLGHYWYATGQLAAMGDPAARAEFWGAMQDGRHRIVNESDEFERTLGWDVAATMPFWIDELRSQCCRIVTSGAGDIVEDVLGLKPACFQSPWRTPYRRAKELRDSAGGKFVRSRIAGRWVPAPR